MLMTPARSFLVGKSSNQPSNQRESPMRSTLIAIPILFICTCIAFAQTNQPTSYKDAVAQCESAITEKTKAVGDTYRMEIIRLKNQFQKEGELEKALAIEKEWSRVFNEKTLTTVDIVEQPEELKQVQTKYVALFSQLSQTVVQDRIELLNDLKRQFTKDGKFDDAIAIKQEIEKLQKRYLSQTASDDKASGVAKKPVDIVTQCEQEIRSKIATALAQYAKELDALAKSFQAKGELEAIMVVKNEQERFKNAGRIDDANIVESPAELHDIQAKYKALPETIGQQTAKQFLTALEEKKKNLTVEGKLDEAMAVKKDIEKIQARYSVASESSNEAIIRVLLGVWNARCRGGYGSVYEFLPDGKIYWHDGGGAVQYPRWRITKDRIRIYGNDPTEGLSIPLPLRPEGSTAVHIDNEKINDKGGLCDVIYFTKVK